jgi:hypothetical protein
MKTIALATAIALVSAAPALAKSGERVQHMRAGHHVMVPHASFAAPDPYGVYINRREIGRAPDANMHSPVQNDYSDQEMGG